MKHKYKNNTKYKKICSGCKINFPGQMEKHHVIPRKDIRFKIHKESIKKRSLTIIVCCNCHKMIHDKFGPGDNYKGPITIKHLIKWLELQQ